MEEAGVPFVSRYSFLLGNANWQKYSAECSVFKGSTGKNALKPEK